VTAPWPCSTCGAPGIRNLGTRGYCGGHLAEVYRRFSPEVWKLRGIGLQDGARRPDHGPECMELRCVACGATWVGPMLEHCYWCERSHARMLDHQAELVLEPPDTDPDDRNHEDRMRAWAERLARAVDAGLVTRERALSVWHREVNDARRAA
jgi:hypothetical protein